MKKMMRKKEEQSKSTLGVDKAAEIEGAMASDDDAYRESTRSATKSGKKKSTKAAMKSVKTQER